MRSTTILLLVGLLCAFSLEIFKPSIQEIDNGTVTADVDVGNSTSAFAGMRTREFIREHLYGTRYCEAITHDAWMHPIVREGKSQRARWPIPTKKIAPDPKWSRPLPVEVRLKIKSMV